MTFATCSVSGNEVLITMPVEFNGPGMTPELVSTFRQVVSSHWSGRTAGGMNMKVVVSEGKGNTVTFAAGIGRAFANGVGGNQATCYANSSAWVMAHEAGHLLGLADRYRDQTDPNGVTVSKPLDGFGGSMMGQYGGSVTPSERSVIMNTWCGVTSGGG
jgi:hypothetical protein